MIWNNRFILALSLLLRLHLSISPSYIHPDEHFQGPEYALGNLFNWAHETTWEFSGSSPIRSYVPLWLLYTCPLSILDFLWKGNLSPREAYWFIRAGHALAFWILGDMALDRLSDSKKSRTKTLYLVGCSYVTWTYQSHTFSNSIETLLVLWCLVIIKESQQRHSMHHQRVHKFMDAGILGLLIVLGTWNRVTFPLWLVVPGLTYLRRYLVHNLSSLALLVASVLLSAFVVVHVDSMHYGLEWTVTPLNSFLYNSQGANLAQHGIHSRLTHLASNLPLLLGPLVFMLRKPKTYYSSLQFQSAVSGTLLLSLFPHQEARFLLPAVPLLICCYDVSSVPSRFTSALFLVSYAFNVAMGFLMGTLHQGGVVPAQHFLSKHVDSGSHTVVYWRTYKPPTWLLGVPEGSLEFVDREHPLGDDFFGKLKRDLDHVYISDGPKTMVTVLDLMGSSPAHVNEVMSALASVNPLLVAPVAGLKELDLPNYREIWKTRFHLGLDHIDGLESLEPGLVVLELL